jgi:hypothetical protein
MAELEQVYGLITSRRIAVVAVALNGITAVTTFRNVFLHFPRTHHFHWLLQLDSLLPAWTWVPINIAFYAFLVCLCVEFFRTSRGRERVMVAGWFPGALLGPFTGISIPATDAIQFFEVAGTTIALVESVLIFREYSGCNGVSLGSSSDGVQESLLDEPQGGRIKRAQTSELFL